MKYKTVKIGELIIPVPKKANYLAWDEDKEVCSFERDLECHDHEDSGFWSGVGPYVIFDPTLTVKPPEKGKWKKQLYRIEADGSLTRVKFKDIL